MIRAAIPADADTVAALLEQLFGVEPDFRDAEGRAKYRRGVELVIGSAHSDYLVCEREGVIAGMVSVQRVASTAAGGWSCLLEDFFVRGEYRAQGVGGLLLDSVADWCRAHECVRIQLVADCENTNAISFYKKRGFSESRMRGMYRYLSIS